MPAYKEIEPGASAPAGRRRHEARAGLDRRFFYPAGGPPPRQSWDGPMICDAVAVGTSPRQVRASTVAERPDTTLGPRVSGPSVRRRRLHPPLVHPLHPLRKTHRPRRLRPVQPVDPRGRELDSAVGVAHRCRNQVTRWLQPSSPRQTIARTRSVAGPGNPHAPDQERKRASLAYAAGKVADVLLMRAR